MTIFVILKPGHPSFFFHSSFTLFFSGIQPVSLHTATMELRGRPHRMNDGEKRERDERGPRRVKPVEWKANVKCWQRRAWQARLGRPTSMDL